jgi:phosphoserine phosphatase RsbU/P
MFDSLGCELTIDGIPPWTMTPGLSFDLGLSTGVPHSPLALSNLAQHIIYYLMRCVGEEMTLEATQELAWAMAWELEQERKGEENLPDNAKETRYNPLAQGTSNSVLKNLSDPLGSIVTDPVANVVSQIPPKILVIDDDRIMLTYVAMMLKQEGYEIHKAKDGDTGLAMAKELKPALIVCDWMMPGTTGLQVCHKIKNDPQMSSTFFILLTAREDVEDRIRGLDMGADEFLSKPVNASEMRARVRAGLRIYQANQDLKTVAQRLQEQKQLLEDELREAADYVRSLLPKPLNTEPRSLYVDSYFVPSKQLGGDFFDFHWLDENRLRIYLMDTAGHGLRAALFSVSLQNFIKSFPLNNPTVDLCDPAQVMNLLNTSFQMENHHDQYVTIWYGIFDRRTQQLTYSNAGHPPAILIDHSHTDPDLMITPLPSTGIPIGILETSNFRSKTCTIRPGMSLYIFSDGLYELNQSEETLSQSAPEEVYGLPEFLKLLEEFENQRYQHNLSLDWIAQEVLKATDNQQFSDDCSLLHVQFDPWCPTL